jgi:thiosulfate dehydrogenase
VPKEVPLPARRSLLLTFPGLVAVMMTTGCGPEPAIDRGRELFSSTSFSAAESNVFACSTCHSIQPGGDPKLLLPGYTLHGVTQRPLWWGGAYDYLLDAVNECYVEFMRGDRLSPDDTDGRALLVYLDSISPEPKQDALPLTIVKDIVDVPNGDVTRGAVAYANGCGWCHGALHTGEGRLGEKVSIVPDDTIKEHGTDPATGARPVTIEKVRHGKFFSIGGNMPPYSLESLSDAQLGDILAYIGI